jgi:hypothetical protein
MATSIPQGADADEDSEKQSSLAQLDTDSNIVDWDGPKDPDNPLNWPASKKNFHVAIVSIFTLVA